jgi:mannose-1-phosphate guanylyltransferase
MNLPPLYAVVLAGGSGTRFWPASRRLRPKQLLPIGPSAPLSLIRGVVDRLGGLVPPERVLVATGSHLLEATRRELPELPPAAFLAEPRARNTAPCIGWAAFVVARREPDAVLCVLPSDQHATDAEAFRAALAVAATQAAAGRITTIGVVPTRPETGFGYLRKGAALAAGVHEVGAFVEKPDAERARQYVASGDYLWNAGMFIFRARDMVAAIRRHLPAMARLLDAVDEAAALGEKAEQQAVARFFEETESVSIDYGVMEKESGLALVVGDFGWSDLGSWEAAWELAARDALGNAAPSGSVLVDSRRNLVADLRSSAAGRVIALVGVEDLVVVETDDALLVMRRDQSQAVREVVDALAARGDAQLL